MKCLKKLFRIEPISFEDPEINEKCLKFWFYFFQMSICKCLTIKLPIMTICFVMSDISFSFLQFQTVKYQEMKIKKKSILWQTRIKIDKIKIKNLSTLKLFSWIVLVISKKHSLKQNLKSFKIPIWLLRNA